MTTPAAPRESARPNREAAAKRPWPLLRLAVASCFLAALAALPASSLFRVQEIRVVGERTIPAAVLASVAGVPLGTRAYAVDLAAVEERLQAIPAVRRASARLVWPSMLEVRVEEREPVIALRTAAAPRALVAVDADGVPFRYVEEAGPLLMIAVDGGLVPWLRLGQPLASRLVRETAEALRTLDAEDRAQVRAIRLRATGDLEVALSGGVRALVRSPSALRDNLPLARQILEGLGPRARAVATIDLRFGRNVVVRPTDPPTPGAAPAAPSAAPSAAGHAGPREAPQVQPRPPAPASSR